MKVRYLKPAVLGALSDDAAPALQPADAATRPDTRTAAPQRRRAATRTTPAKTPAAAPC